MESAATFDVQSPDYFAERSKHKAGSMLFDGATLGHTVNHVFAVALATFGLRFGNPRRICVAQGQASQPQKHHESILQKRLQIFGDEKAGARRAA
jgi:hypothetical protein